jgi:tetratricopeptide (TPR) repeat protein
VAVRIASSTAFARGRAVAITCVLLLAVLVPVLRSAHRHTDAWAPRHAVTDEIRYLPTGQLLKAASMGYETLVADMLWARTTLLFGKNFEQEDTDWYAWVFHMIDLATDLDPEFKAAYKYGGLMLRAEQDFIDQSSLIYQKGMVALPENHYFPFFIAMNYFQYKDDRATAADYMEIAARCGTGPAYLPSLAASLRTEVGDPREALMFLEEELRAVPADEEALRTAVEVKIFETRYEIALQDAQGMVEQYRRQTGSLPASPADVVELGLVLPEDPLGGVWAYNPSSKMEIGTVWSSARCRVFTSLSREHGLGRSTPVGCEDSGE